MAGPNAVSGSLGDMFIDINYGYQQNMKIADKVKA